MGDPVVQPTVWAVQLPDRDGGPTASIVLQGDGRWRAKVKSGSTVAEPQRDFDRLEDAKRWAVRALTTVARAVDRLEELRDRVSHEMGRLQSQPLDVLLADDQEAADGG